MNILTTGQAAKALQISIDTVIRLIQLGELKAERLTDTSRYRIREEDLLEYAQRKQVRLYVELQSE